MPPEGWPRRWFSCNFFATLGIIVMQCGPIDLVAGIPRQLNDTQIGYGALPDYEDMMTWKFPVASKLAVLLAATAVVATGLAPGQRAVAEAEAPAAATV